MDDSHQQKVRTGARCSFCSRDHSQMRKLIAVLGGVCICDNCVEIAHSIIFAEKLEEKKKQNFHSLKQAVGV